MDFLFSGLVNHQHRHSDEAIEICRRRARLYEQARQSHHRRWRLDKLTS